MSANPVARPQSRRGLLTAALAGTAASAVTFGGHVVLAATAEPDPIFAAIARERAADAAWGEAHFAHDIAKSTFRVSGLDRKPRACIGEYVSFQRRTAPGVYEEVPEDEQVPVPVYAYDHAAIDRDCDLHRDVTHSPKAEPRRARLHAALDADAAEIAKAKAPVIEAEDAYKRLMDEWEEKRRILIEIVPTTAAGLLALIDRLEERCEGSMVDPTLEGLDAIFVHVRRFLLEARA